MVRKLKTYQTSLGFFDLAIAAPSMKAALEAWGADSNLFHQGAAKESDDPDIIAAAIAASMPAASARCRRADAGAVQRAKRFQDFIDSHWRLQTVGGPERRA